MTTKAEFLAHYRAGDIRGLVDISQESIQMDQKDANAMKQQINHLAEMGKSAAEQSLTGPLRSNFAPTPAFETEAEIRTKMPLMEGGAIMYRRNTGGVGADSVIHNALDGRYHGLSEATADAMCASGKLTEIEPGKFRHVNQAKPLDKQVAEMRQAQAVADQRQAQAVQAEQQREAKQKSSFLKLWEHPY